MGGLDRAFEAIGRLLGCTPGQGKVAVGGFLFVLAVGVYLAGTAASNLSSEYETLAKEVENVEERDLGDLTPAEMQERRLRERIMLPQLLMEGQIVPDAPLRPDGKALRCSELLRGRSGLSRGWVWIPEERGCRRVAPQR